VKVLSIKVLTWFIFKLQEIKWEGGWTPLGMCPGSGEQEQMFPIPESGLTAANQFPPPGRQTEGPHSTYCMHWEREALHNLWFPAVRTVRQPHQPSGYEGHAVQGTVEAKGSRGPLWRPTGLAK
jgi:hypothetical protein